MSAFSPPIYYFTDINFDSSYYASPTTTGLTVAQANTLYLQKSTADTAAAVETFTSGILTGSIDTEALLQPLSLGTVNATSVTLGSVSSSNIFYGLLRFPNMGAKNFYYYNNTANQTLS